MPRTSILRKNSSGLPVIIVGAGPVGLFLANLLGSKKIPVLVFEKRSRGEILQGSRAIGITAPSLRLLNEVGLLKPLQKCGVFIQEAEVFENGESVGILNFDVLPKPWLPTLSVPQFETTRVLLEGLRRFKHVKIYWNTGFLENAQSSTHSVRAVFRSITGRPFSVDGAFLVGCDGHRSQVRAALKIPVRETTSDEEFLMADFKGDHPLNKKAALFFSGRGAAESFPMTKDLRRWILQLRPERFITRERFEKKLASSPQDISAFFLTELRVRSGFAVNGILPRSFQWFRPRRLESKNYFHGRSILCGDAAHVISPIGAQGMNSGFLGASQIAHVIARYLQIPANDLYSSDKRLVSKLKRYQFTQKKMVSRAGRRAELHMWIGTRTHSLFSFFRKCAVRMLLTRFFSPILARRFAMLDLLGH